MTSAAPPTALSYSGPPSSERIREEHCTDDAIDALVALGDKRAVA